MEFVEFVVSEWLSHYGPPNTYIILGRFWDPIRRKHIDYKSSYILEIDVKELYQMIMENNKLIRDRIYLVNSEIYFYNKENAESMLEFINSLYVMNKLTK